MSIKFLGMSVPPETISGQISDYLPQEVMKSQNLRITVWSELA